MTLVASVTSPQTALMAGGDGSERQALIEELFGSSGQSATFEGRLLRTREVALLFQVSERAVTDWARRGRIPSVRTPGGHRRYPAEQVRALLEQSGADGRA
jgi:excisionase family DNA binding protein